MQGWISVGGTTTPLFNTCDYKSEHDADRHTTGMTTRLFPIRGMCAPLLFIETGTPNS